MVAGKEEEKKKAEDAQRRRKHKGENDSQMKELILEIQRSPEYTDLL